MARELISKHTLRALREYFVGTSLRIIHDVFTDANVACDLEHVPNSSGDRRTLVEQYYITLDLSDPADAEKLLGVFESVLVTLENTTGFYEEEYAEKEISRLLSLLRRDGYEYFEGRLVAKGRGVTGTVSLRKDAISVDAHYLVQHIERIEKEVDSDPRHAIGLAKELVETTCKTILRERKVDFSSKSDVMQLVKETRKALKLVPDEIPDSAKAADTIKRLLSNVASIAQNLAELRNSYGSGHGPDGNFVGLQPRHARLAAGSACVLAKFLLETHQTRE